MAGHTYCYAVFSTKTKSGVDLFTSPTYQSFTALQPASASSTAPVNFDVIGDTGENFAQTGTDGSGNTVSTPFPSSVDPTGVENPYQSDLYSQIGNDFTGGQAQFLLGAGDTSYSGGSENTLGDLTQPGTLAQAQGKSATEYSNIFGPTYLPEARGVPTYLADGNHGQNSNVLKGFPAQVYPIAPVAPTPWTATAASTASAGASRTTGTRLDRQVRMYVLDAAWVTALSARRARRTRPTPTSSNCSPTPRR